MYSEPQKITICGIDEYKYAVHFWNCGKNNANLPFASTKAAEISGWKLS